MKLHAELFPHINLLHSTENPGTKLFMDSAKSWLTVAAEVASLAKNDPIRSSFLHQDTKMK